MNKKEILLQFIREEYRISGQYPSYSRLMILMNYKSKRSISILISDLVEGNVLRKTKDGGYKLAHFDNLNHDETIVIQLLGEIACGIPIFAEQNIEMQFSISKKFLNRSSKYFLLRAIGDSMNQAYGPHEGIDDGDLLLIEVRNWAEEDEWIVALINNEATVKSFHPRNGHIILKPSSDNPIHRPIILDEDFKVQGVVKKVFKNFDLV